MDKIEKMAQLVKEYETVEELLQNHGEKPIFFYIGRDGVYRSVKCKVVEAV